MRATSVLHESADTSLYILLQAFYYTEKNIIGKKNRFTTIGPKVGSGWRELSLTLPTKKFLVNSTQY